MQIQDIISVVEQFAPPALQESYDNSGVQCGNTQMPASGVLLSLDITHEVLKEAIKKKCNLIIAHHPLIFSPLKQLTGKNYVEQLIIKAIKNDIVLYACHTNADNIQAGVNKKIAEKIGLLNTRILQPKKRILKKLVTFCPEKQAASVQNALFDAGCGHIGNYDRCSFSTNGNGTFRANEHAQPFVGEKHKQHTETEIKIETIFESYKEHQVVQTLLQAHPYEEAAYDIYTLDNTHPQIGSGMVGELAQPMSEKDFLQHLKQSFGARGIRYTRFLNQEVKKVALCGGSGSFLLKEAIKAGAHMFVSADFKYHQFFDADNHIVIADIGHYETEHFTPEIFYSQIVKKFSTFAVHLSDHNTNPVNYF
ncbi:MAG: Nif3-like dinuclear metal center hexameric protein [Bacteroidetes bacterium]|nr:Nif3-like dinuclear metal center hexameric protein [Bacteroidota bacterium]